MYSVEPEYEGNKDEQARDEAWRQEVASRVNSYRAKRRRKGDDQSLRLDFEADPPTAPRENRREAADTNFYRRANAAFDQPAGVDVPLAHATGEASAAEDAEWLYTGAPAQSRNENTDYDPDFDFDSPRVIEEPAETARPESNVIVFPRPIVPAPKPPADELAEPVLDHPRILDVPEEIGPTIQGPLFAHVELEPDEPKLAAPPAPEFEIPPQVALVALRATAALIDFLLVLAACAGFAATVWKLIPDIPHTKALGAAAVVTLMLFWSLYQYLFLVYGGRTVGMELAGVTLRNFEGNAPHWTERKRRALSMVLSFISVGLGFAWALVDQDMLCWHDRISRTYVAQR